jgi:hypothetical protein
VTVAANATRINYSTPGQTAFAYPFECWADTDVVVYTYDATNGLVLATQGAGTSQIPNLQYTVNRTAKTVTIGAALPASTTLTIMRLLPLTQDTSVRYAGTFDPGVHEDTFDKLEMKIQELQEQLNRALLAPVTTAPADFSGILPQISGKVGLVLATNAAGNGIDLVSPGSNIQITTGADGAYAFPSGVDGVVCFPHNANPYSITLPSAFANPGRVIRVAKGNDAAVITVVSPTSSINGSTNPFALTFGSGTTFVSCKTFGSNYSWYAF